MDVSFDHLSVKDKRGYTLVSGHGLGRNPSGCFGDILSKAASKWSGILEAAKASLCQMGHVERIVSKATISGRYV